MSINSAISPDLEFKPRPMLVCSLCH